MRKRPAPAVKMLPSGSPENVPTTASARSLAMIVNVCPALGVNPSTTFSVALPRVTPPVTLTWSYCVPAVVPLISTVSVLPAVSVSVPVLRIPGEAPGAIVPPLLTVTVLPIVPVPPSVPPLFTVTGEAIEPGLLTSNVPAFTVVAPL